MFHHRQQACMFFPTAQMFYIIFERLFFFLLTAPSCSDLLWLLFLGVPFVTFPVSWFPPLPLPGFPLAFCWCASSSHFLVPHRAEPFWEPGRSPVPPVGVPSQALFPVFLSHLPPLHLLFVFQKHVEMSCLLMSLLSPPLTFWGDYLFTVILLVHSLSF